MSCPLLLPSNSPFTGLKWFDCGIGCSMISAFGTPLLLHSRTRWRHLWTIWKVSILHWSSAIAIYHTTAMYRCDRFCIYMKNKKVPHHFLTFVMIRFRTINEMFMFAGITLWKLWGCHPVLTAERESNTSTVNSLAPWGSLCCLCNRSWTVTTLVHSGSDCTCYLRLWNSLPNAKFGNF
jgi:hypothetical protein